jgi:predicted RNA-binding protein with PIN domain
MKVKFCPTCLNFCNQFAAKTEQLLVATSDMAGAAGIRSKREVFEAARVEVQRLRAECETVKAAMKRHQTEHGDT